MRKNLGDKSREISEEDRARIVRIYEAFEEQKPEYVFLAAAKVGGILANRDYPADFIRDNLAVQLALPPLCDR